MLQQIFHETNPKLGSFCFLWLDHSMQRVQRGSGTGPQLVAVSRMDYTTVQTVFSVVSNLTALASVGFIFVSYIGFSNDA